MVDIDYEVYLGLYVNDQLFNFFDDRTLEDIIPPLKGAIRKGVRFIEALGATRCQSENAVTYLQVNLRDGKMENFPEEFEIWVDSLVDAVNTILIEDFGADDVS